MSDKTINTRIKQRYDTIQNWSVSNIPNKGANLVLKEGELAIAECGNGIVKFKVGNGLSTFAQLKFVGEIELSTGHLTAYSIAQGLKASARPYGIAAGAYLSALADFSQVMGYNAKSVLSDSYSFVWNGDESLPLGQYPGGHYYESHGKGTFNINPINGLSGIYIGEENLSVILDNKIPNITVDGNKTGLLGVEHISKEEYERRVTANDGSILSNTIYVISSETIDARGEQIKNVGYPTDLSDAITMQYADEHYLSAHQSLSAYYTKSQTNALSSTFRSGLATTEQLTAYQPKGNYLTAHQSLTAYETKDKHTTDIRALSNAISSKVLVDGQYAENIQIKNISIGEYAQLLKDGEVLSNCIYEVSSDAIDAFNQRIVNVADPIDNQDAATKNYVDNAVKNNVQVSAVLDSGTQIASISVNGVATSLYAPASGGGIYRYPLITTALSTINGSLCCLIQDHAVTTIEVSSATTPLVITLPPKPSDNGARDFILRIEVSSSTAPGVTFVGLDESITFDSDSDDWMTIEPGLNLISFTETR